MGCLVGGGDGREQRPSRFCWFSVVSVQCTIFFFFYIFNALSLRIGPQGHKNCKQRPHLGLILENFVTFGSWYGKRYLRLDCKRDSGLFIFPRYSCLFRLNLNASRSDDCRALDERRRFVDGTVPQPRISVRLR